MQTVLTILEEAGEIVYYLDTWFVAVGVCRKFCLMVMSDFFLPKTASFQIQFVYSGSILATKVMREIFKKD